MTDLTKKFIKTAKGYYETMEDIVILKESLENTLILAGKEICPDHLVPLLTLNLVLTETLTDKSNY